MIISDKQLVEDMIAFLQGFYFKYPEFYNRKLFISGHSYAGHNKTIQLLFIRTLSVNCHEYQECHISLLSPVDQGNPFIIILPHSTIFNQLFSLYQFIRRFSASYNDSLWCFSCLYMITHRA